MILLQSLQRLICGTAKQCLGLWFVRLRESLPSVPRVLSISHLLSIKPVSSREQKSIFKESGALQWNNGCVRCG